jgi:hypothetical protein
VCIYRGNIGKGKRVGKSEEHRTKRERKEMRKIHKAIVHK